MQGRTEVEFEDPLMQELGRLVRGSSLFVVGATRAKAAGSFDEAVTCFGWHSRLTRTTTLPV